MATIESEWKEFESKAVPAAAGKRQRADLRRAFYAGSVSAMELLVEALRNGPKGFDAMLDQFEAELKRFQAARYAYDADEWGPEIGPPAQ